MIYITIIWLICALILIFQSFPKDWNNINKYCLYIIIQVIGAPFICIGYIFELINLFIILSDGGGDDFDDS